MSHVFISYSRKDIYFAQKIVDALAENNLDTWIDWKSIPKGEDWMDEIYRGIEGADAFLFLISPDSVKSRMCSKEIVHAVKNSKRILPIVLRDASIKEFPVEVAKKEISKRNWIFCRAKKDNFKKAIKEIGKTIHSDYEWIKYHTDLQLKALSWKKYDDGSRLLRGKELQEAEERIVHAGDQKEPHTTELQRLYVTASRRAESRQTAKELRQARALAKEQRKRADEQQRLRLGTLSVVLANQADSILDIQQETSEKGPLLALQAYDFHAKYQGFMVSAIDKALRKSLGYWKYAQQSETVNGGMSIETSGNPVNTDSAKLPVTNPSVMYNQVEFLCLAYSRDNRYLAIAKSSGVTEVWLADRIKPVAELVSDAYTKPLARIHYAGGNALSMSFGDENILGILYEDDHLVIYQINGLTCTELAQILLPSLTFEYPDDHPYPSGATYRKITCPILFYPGRQKVIAANRNIAYVWKYDESDSRAIPLKMPDFKITDPFNQPHLMDLVFSSGGDILALWSEGVLAWYSSTSLELIAQVKLDNWNPVHSYGYGFSRRYANAMLSSQGHWIALCGMDGERPPTSTIYVWRTPETYPSNQEVLKPYYMETLDSSRWGLDIMFSHDSYWLVG